MTKTSAKKPKKTQAEINYENALRNHGKHYVNLAEHDCNLMRLVSSMERSAARGVVEPERVRLRDLMLLKREGLVMDCKVALAVIEQIKAEGFTPPVKEREVFEVQQTFLLE